MADELRILQVEDSPDDATLILRILRKGGLVPVSERVDREASLRKALAAQPWDIVLSDYAMPGFGGGQALKIVMEMRPDLPFILVSGAVGEEISAELMRLGANDVVLKDNLARLVPAIERELRDAEERRHHRLAEKALRESEEQFRTLVENIPGVVYRCELPAPWQVDHISAAIEPLTGYPAGDFVAGEISYGSLVYEEDIGEVERAVAAGIDTHQPYVIEYRIRHRDGSLRWCHEKGRAIYAEDGKPLWLDGVIIDITSHKLMEEEKEKLQSQLRQAQKMEAIGTLAGGIAHDFNNILAAILGYADLARAELPAASQARLNLDQVIQAGNRAKDLVRHILSFSRKSDLGHHGAVQVNLLVKEAIQLLRASIPTTIEIRQQIDPECRMVNADATQLHQVLINLCTNAAQAMELKGGLLEVSLQNVMFGPENPPELPELCFGEYVLLQVADNGPGIDPAIRERIFEPYFTTKEVGKGTGMGLAVVHGIIKGYGGAIKLESSPGAGAVFSVYLPAAQKVVTSVLEVDNSVPMGTERVLFVDDEEMLVRLGKVIFEGLGYTVTAMQNSVEALELFKSDPKAFDLVITDQTMPHLPGMELAAEVLKIRPDMPIILCTGYSSVVDEAKAKAVGVREFAMKPFVRNEISRLVRRALAGR